MRILVDLSFSVPIWRFFYSADDNYKIPYEFVYKNKKYTNGICIVQFGWNINNVYGLNQYPEKLIPRFIKLLFENKPVTIQGDGTNVRAFLHVDDVSCALKYILANGKIGDIYNIGSDDKDEYTVLQIAQILIKKILDTKEYDKYITYIEDRPFNDKRYYISNEKVKALGWEIEKDFNTGINELIDNYK